MNCGFRFTTYEISKEDYLNLKGKEKENETIIADMLSYLDEFYKKVSERNCKNED